MGLFSQLFKSEDPKPEPLSNIITAKEFNGFDEEIAVLCHVLSLSTLAFIECSYSGSVEEMLKELRERFSSIDVAGTIQHYSFEEGQVFNNGSDILWSYDLVTDVNNRFSAIVFSVYAARGEYTEEEWNVMVKQIATFATCINSNPLTDCVVGEIKIGHGQGSNDESKLVFPNPLVADAFKKTTLVRL